MKTINAFLLSTVLVQALNGCALFTGSRISDRGKDTERVRFLLPTGDTLSPTGVTHLCRFNQDRMAVVSDQGVLIVNGYRLLDRVDTPKEITAIVELHGDLYIGTATGLYRLANGGKQFVPIELPAIKPHPPVTALAVGRDDSLWIGTERNSLFVMNNGKISPIPGAPYVSSLAVTSEGSVWIGTNIGLHRYRDGKYYAYSEEIHHYGLAIPDNIVERVQTDQIGNLWVFMSQAVSVITPTQFESREGDHIDPVTYAYFGSRENEIFRLLDGPERSRWIASEKGLLLLKDIELDHKGAVHQDGLGDILTPPEGELLNINQMLVHSDSTFAASQSRDILLDENGDLWVGANTGLWKVDRALVQHLSGGVKSISAN